MNILIINHYFPPLAHISLRIYYLAKYFARNGHNVVVLTTEKLPIHGVISDDLKVEGFRLVSVPHFPFSLFFGKKTNVKELGGKIPSSVPRSVLFRLKSVRDFFLKIFGPNFDILLPCVPFMFFRALEMMRHTRFDALITSHPPPFVFFVGYLIKRVRPDIVWLADFRDLWSYDFHFSNFLSSFFSVFLEKRILSRADEIVTVSGALARKLERLHGRKVHIIRNSFDHEILPVAINDRGVRGGDGEKKGGRKLKFVYTGAFYHRTIDPRNFFEALSILKMRRSDLSERMEVEIYGVPNIDLDGMIKQFGIGDIVRYMGLVSQRKSFEIQRYADFLLFFNMTELIQGDDIGKGVVTGKIYEYIASGVPIISIGCLEDSEANMIIRDTGTGIFVYNLPEKIADFLEDLIYNRGGEAYFFEPKIDKIMGYSAAIMAEKFLKLIEGRIGG